MLPFVIGITGRGVVADGAIELIMQSSPYSEYINPSDIPNLKHARSIEDLRKRVFVTQLSREHYLKGTPPTSVLATEVLP